ncbi:hypothetical protein, partial [Evtepia gabavorous]|uniref:hypothetical protein n=1 Tax=Evtepia gabavorous TaxID=2211183 RepID=UPI003A90FE9E
ARTFSTASLPRLFSGLFHYNTLIWNYFQVPAYFFVAAYKKAVISLTTGTQPFYNESTPG